MRVGWTCTYLACSGLAGPDPDPEPPNTGKFMLSSTGGEEVRESVAGWWNAGRDVGFLGRREGGIRGGSTCLILTAFPFGSLLFQTAQFCAS